MIEFEIIKSVYGYCGFNVGRLCKSNVAPANDGATADAGITKPEVKATALLPTFSAVYGSGSAGAGGAGAIAIGSTGAHANTKNENPGFSV